MLCMFCIMVFMLRVPLPDRMESSVGSTRPNLVKSQDLVSTKTIRQNPQECYANPHENPYLMEHAGYWPWCLFHCSFRNLGLPTRLAQILHRHLNHFIIDALYRRPFQCEKSPIDKPILEALISFHSHPYQTAITL